MAKTKKKEFIMFSIDSSTKKTGVTVWRNARYEETYLIDYDESSYDKEDPIKPLCKTMDTRFPLMCKDLIALLNKYQPDIIYIEENVVTRNMDTCRFLFRLQGVIYGWAVQHNCEFNTVRPTEWRKACNFKQGSKIKREELKQQAIQYVKNLLGITVTDDEAESICTGMYVLKLFHIDFQKE